MASVERQVTLLLQFCPLVVVSFRFFVPADQESRSTSKLRLGLLFDSGASANKNVFFGEGHEHTE